MLEVDEGGYTIALGGQDEDVQFGVVGGVDVSTHLHQIPDHVDISVEPRIEHRSEALDISLIHPLPNVGVGQHLMVLIRCLSPQKFLCQPNVLFKQLFLSVVAEVMHDIIPFTIFVLPWVQFTVLCEKFSHFHHTCRCEDEFLHLVILYHRIDSFLFLTTFIHLDIILSFKLISHFIILYCLSIQSFYISFQRRNFSFSLFLLPMPHLFIHFLSEFLC